MNIDGKIGATHYAKHALYAFLRIFGYRQPEIISDKNSVRAKVNTDAAFFTPFFIYGYFRGRFMLDAVFDLGHITLKLY